MSENDNDFANRNNDPVRVFLDSKNAYSTERGKYRFFLNLEAYYDTFYIYFQVRKIQCTYSWYNIDSANNLLSFNNQQTVITVPPGNYSLGSLLDFLNRNNGNYRFSYDYNTGLVSVAGSNLFSWDATSSLYNVLGWTAFPTGTNATFTANALPDVSPIKVVNFHFQSVPSRSFALYPSSQYSRLVGSLFVGNAIPYNVIETTDETIYRESTLQSELRQIEIALFDQSGQPVELQNGSFQMLIEFSFRPKKVFRLNDFM